MGFWVKIVPRGRLGSHRVRKLECRRRWFRDPRALGIEAHKGVDVAGALSVEHDLLMLCDLSIIVECRIVASARWEKDDSASLLRKEGGSVCRRKTGAMPVVATTAVVAISGGSAAAGERMICTCASLSEFDDLCTEARAQCHREPLGTKAKRWLTKLLVDPRKPRCRKAGAKKAEGVPALVSTTRSWKTRCGVAATRGTPSYRSTVSSAKR